MAEAAAVVTSTANTLESLCPELIVEILSHLTIGDLCRVARVCKQFKELAYSKKLWGNVEFRRELQDSVDEAVVPSLAQKGI